MSIDEKAFDFVATQYFYDHENRPFVRSAFEAYEAAKVSKHPVSVSLEKCADKCADEIGRRPDGIPYDCVYRATKAVLDAAGVAYAS